VDVESAADPAIDPKRVYEVQLSLLRILPLTCRSKEGSPRQPSAAGRIRALLVGLLPFISISRRP